MNLNAKLAGEDESALSSDPTLCQCVRLRDGGGFKRSSILFNRFHWAPFQRTGYIIYLRLNAASKIKRKNLTAPLQRQKLRLQRFLEEQQRRGYIQMCCFRTS
jgi:hypothetical protein